MTKKLLTGAIENTDKVEWLNDSGEMVISYVKRFKNMYKSNNATEQDTELH